MIAEHHMACLEKVMRPHRTDMLGFAKKLRVLGFRENS